jgi:pimeloyl-ACP methyl ester carboxylesterase
MRETIVFLPGMMCDARLFGPQLAAMSSTHAVMIAPITLGERVEEIAGALLDLLPRKFALAGLSMGGIVAMELMRRAPERITRLCLLDTNPLAETPQVAAMRESQIVAAKTGRLLEVMRDEMKPNYLAPGPARQDVLDLVMEMARTLGPDVLIRQSRALQRRRDQQGTLLRVNVPTMIICGEHDALCPVRRHTFMAELIVNARLHVLENAGHLPTLETPNEVIDLLYDWMNMPTAA